MSLPCGWCAPARCAVSGCRGWVCGVCVRREQIYLEGVELFPEPTSGAQSLPWGQEGAGEGTLFLAVGWG